jgi:P27 family predicted phage terminase small subunit
VPLPEPPEWVSDEAAAVWRRLAPAMAIDAATDALTVYCCAVADYEHAQQTLDRTGVVVRGARGGLVRNPLVLVRNEAAQTMRGLAPVLGLTGAPAPPEEPPASSSWRNRAATERTIAALRAGGRLEETDAAATALARHLAAALDDTDGARFPAQTASLARVQLATLRTLRGIDDDSGHDPDVGDLLAFLSAPVGDTPQP